MLSTQSRFWIVLLFFSLVLITSAHAFADRVGLLWGFGIAFSVNCLFYFYSDQRLVDLFTARPLEGHDPWGILETVRNLARRLGLPVPRVYLIDTPAAQAFAAGRSPSYGRIFLTEGLVRNLTTQELNSILAVQMVHLKNHDSFAFSALSLLSGSVLTLTRLIDRGVHWLIELPRDIEIFQGGYLTRAVAPFLALLLRLCLSAENYLQADSKAATLVGDKQALASALWKLSSLAQTQPFAAPASTAHLFVVNPLTENGWFRYFRWQPQAAQRMRNLVGQYPI